MSRIRQIAGPDGTPEPFRERKIADSALYALRAVGVDDRALAEELAHLVVMVLERECAEGGLPTVEQVELTLERVLDETGHGDAARELARWQECRRKLVAELRVLGPQPGRATPLAQHWDRPRLVAGLEREQELPVALAEEVASGIEQRIAAAGLTTVSARLVSELRDFELVERGLEAREALGSSIPICRNALERDLEAERDTAESSERIAARLVFPGFALHALHDDAVRRAHEQARLHLYGLDDPYRVDRLILRAEHLAARIEGEDPILELGLCVARLRDHVRDEIVLPDLGPLLARLCVGEDPDRVARRTLRALDGRDARGRQRGPRLRIGVSLDDADGAEAPMVAALRRAVLEGRDPSPAQVPTLWWPVAPGAAVAAAEDAASDTLLRERLAAAAERPGAQLAFHRGEDPASTPATGAAPWPIITSIARVAINLPLATLRGREESLEAAIDEIGSLAELARKALIERYWAQRASHEWGLAGIVMELGGPRAVTVPASGQEVDVELLGLPLLLAEWEAAGVMRPADRPGVVARILARVDYEVGDERDGVSFRVRLGATLDRGVRERLHAAREAWLGEASGATPKGKASLEGANLPVVLPLDSERNAPLFGAAFAERLGEGLCLPLPAFEGQIGRERFEALGTSTRLAQFALRLPDPSDGIFEVQEELF